MSTEKMREEFEAAFLAEEVSLCGEGMRSSALYMIEQDTVNVRSAWWAWQASRAAIEVELPAPAVQGGNCIRDHAIREAIESLGLKVKL
ncbi:hypothetical protein [Pseudomonas fluorescens]|uniref:hypothetical protein n=1 Tax=Pseudomonas fluorescens TaxID=294 RepID=UPI00165564F4|nr:hypothetical protein [Pseudomonas fluorescens]MBC8786362.1 hypothetical protein [Pseudomonas fluorescens]